MQTFASIIDAFGGYAKFARAIGVDKLGTVSAWKTRDSIPSSYWRRVVAAAEKEGVAGVSLEALSAIAESRECVTRP